MDGQRATGVGTSDGVSGRVMAHDGRLDSQAALWEMALTHHRAGRGDEAITAYGRVIEASPADAARAWINLGVALRARKNYAAAVAAYRRALELEPDHPGCLSNLGNALKDDGRLDEAIAAHGRSVELRPQDAGLHHNYGIALREAGHMPAALDALDRSCRLDPDRPTAQWDRAQALLYLGRFDQGWDAFEWRWRIGEIAKIKSRKPEWRGETFRGRTLLVYPEQGFGDTILMSRYLPMVKQRGGRVLLLCKTPLLRLFSGIGDVDELIPAGEGIGEFDIHIPMMSLPRIFGTTGSTISRPARLHVPREAKARADVLLDRGRDHFKLGIVWSGSSTFKGNARRSASLERFFGLAEIPGVQLYSLQKGEREADLDAAGARGLVIDAGAQVEDFADTAALIEGLDLVVMTDSAVAHLTGSLGKPAWNLLNHVPYWLYRLDGETTPWYPSMRLLRQPAPGD